MVSACFRNAEHCGVGQIEKCIANEIVVAFEPYVNAVYDIIARYVDKRLVGLICKIDLCMLHDLHALGGKRFLFFGQLFSGLCVVECDIDELFVVVVTAAEGDVARCFSDTVDLFPVGSARIHGDGLLCVCIGRLEVAEIPCAPCGLDH